MTFRDGPPTPRPCACRCTCADPGPLAQRLRAAAKAYVGALKHGSEIHMDIDGAAVAPFWNYLFEAIADAGFTCSVRAEDGTTIYTVRHLTDTRATTQGEAA